MRDTANSAAAESDTSLSLSDAMKLDFEEAEEANPQTEQTAAEQEPDDTTDVGEEAEDEGSQDETEGEEAESDEDKANPEPVDASDDHLVTLQDGSKVPVKELRAGYMKDKDYRHKTHAIGERSRALEGQTQRVIGIVEALADKLSKFVPAKPDASLAMTNAAEYTKQMAMHEQAMGFLNEVVDLGTKSKEAAKELTDDQRRERIASENAKLVARMPVLKDNDKRNEITRKTMEAAAFIGFTPEEVMRNPDHRFYLLGHYAAMGIAAEEAAKKAKQKVQTVPPVTPRPKPGVPGEKSKVIANKKAMARLNKTGSIKDAMSIDFD